MPRVKHSLLSVDNVCVKNRFTDMLQSITKEFPSFEGRKKNEKKKKKRKIPRLLHFNVMRYNHYNFKYFLKHSAFVRIISHK